MAQKKRTPKPPPPAEVAKPPPPPQPPGVPQAETVCVTFDPHQKERMAALLKKGEPKDWGRTQWVRYAMAVHELVERALEGIVPELDAYAVQHRLTVPAARRKRDDWEWQVDALGMLARERLKELQDKPPPPAEQ